MRERTAEICAVFAVLLALTDTAAAYVGPGAGLGAIGTVIALIGAILLAVVGFVWYPIKRLLLRRRKSRESESTDR